MLDGCSKVAKSLLHLLAWRMLLLERSQLFLAAGERGKETMNLFLLLAALLL
jgi:hypothetical protein